MQGTLSRRTTVEKRISTVRKKAIRDEVPHIQKSCRYYSPVHTCDLILFTETFASAGVPFCHWPFRCL